MPQGADKVTCFIHHPDYRPIWYGIVRSKFFFVFIQTLEVNSDINAIAHVIPDAQVFQKTVNVKISPN